MSEPLRKEQIARVCSWCQKHLGGPDPLYALEISHGMCEECRDRFYEEHNLPRSNPAADLDPVLLRIPCQCWPLEVRDNPSFETAQRMARGDFGIRKDVRAALEQLGRKKTIDAAIDHLRRRAKELHRKYVLPLVRRQLEYRQRIKRRPAEGYQPELIRSYHATKKEAEVELDRVKRVARNARADQLRIRKVGDRWQIWRPGEALTWPPSRSPMEKNDWTIFAIRYLWELGGLLEDSLAGMVPTPTEWHLLITIEALQFVETLNFRYRTAKGAIKGLLRKAEALRKGTKTKRGNVPAAEILEKHAKVLSDLEARGRAVQMFQPAEGPIPEEKRLPPLRDAARVYDAADVEGGIMVQLRRIMKDPALKALADELAGLSGYEIRRRIWAASSPLEIGGRSYRISPAPSDWAPAKIVLEWYPKRAASLTAGRTRRVFGIDADGKIVRRMLNAEKVQSLGQPYEGDAEAAVELPVVRARAAGEPFLEAIERYHYEGHPKPGELIAGGREIPRPFEPSQDIRTVWEGMNEGRPGYRIQVVVPSEGPSFFIGTRHVNTTPPAGGHVYVRFLESADAPRPPKAVQEALLEILRTDDLQGPAPSDWHLDARGRKVDLPAALVARVLELAVPELAREARANPAEPRWHLSGRWLVERVTPKTRRGFARGGYRIKPVKDGTQLLFGCPRGLYEKQAKRCRPSKASVKRAKQHNRKPPTSGLELVSIRRTQDAPGAAAAAWRAIEDLTARPNPRDKYEDDRPSSRKVLAGLSLPIQDQRFIDALKRASQGQVMRWVYEIGAMAAREEMTLSQALRIALGYGEPARAKWELLRRRLINLGMTMDVAERILGAALYAGFGGRKIAPGSRLDVEVRRNPFEDISPELDPLFRRAQQGDMQAWYEMVMRVQPFLEGIAKKRLGDPFTAEDVAMQTWADVVRIMQSGEKVPNPTALVIQIAKRRVVDEKRRKGRRDRSVVDSRQVPFGDLSRGGAVGAPSRDKRRYFADDLRTSGELTPDAYEYLQRLPELVGPRYGPTLKLLLEGYEPSEIAEKLGVDQKKARNLAYRARARAKELIRERGIDVPRQFREPRENPALKDDRQLFQWLAVDLGTTENRAAFDAAVREATPAQIFRFVYDVAAYGGYDAMFRTPTGPQRRAALLAAAEAKGVSATEAEEAFNLLVDFGLNDLFPPPFLAERLGLNLWDHHPYEWLTADQAAELQSEQTETFLEEEPPARRNPMDLLVLANPRSPLLYCQKCSGPLEGEERYTAHGLCPSCLKNEEGFLLEPNRCPRCRRWVGGSAWGPEVLCWACRDDERRFSGGSRENPVQTSAPSKKKRAALQRTYRRFHGTRPQEVLRVQAPPGTPSGLVVLGELDHVGYQVPNHSGKAGRRNIPYRHHFGEEDARTGKKRARRGRRPLLATDASGRHLFVIGGDFAVKPEGIVG